MEKAATQPDLNLTTNVSMMPGKVTVRQNGQQQYSGKNS
jgi:hypothetical protein